jgi:hypothetical protein
MHMADEVAGFCLRNMSLRKSIVTLGTKCIGFALGSWQYRDCAGCLADVVLLELQ